VRKILYNLFFLFLIVSCEKKIDIHNDVLDFVPQNSSLIIKINSESEFNKQTINNPIISHILSIDKKSVETLKKILPEKITPESILCVAKVSKNKTGYLYVGKKNKMNSDEKELLIEYSNEKIILTKKNIYVSKIDSFSIRSNSKFLIENCIRNHQSSLSGINSPEYNKIKVTLNRKSDLNILINPSKNTIFKKLFDKYFFPPKLGFNWNAYDFEFDDELINANGVVEIKDSLINPIGIYKNIGLNNSSLENIVPIGYTSFLSVPFMNNQILFDNVKKFIDKKNVKISNKNFQIINSIKELGWIRFNENKYFILTANNELTLDSILNLKKLRNKKYRNSLYHKLDKSEQLKTLSNILGSEVNGSWLTKILNFYVVAESEKSIKEIINSSKDFRTLKFDKDFMNLKNSISKKNSFSWYINTEKAIKILSNLDSKNKSLDGDVKHISFHGVSDDNFMYLNFKTKKSNSNHSIYNMSKKIFELDDKIELAPKLVLNHNTNNHDIFVQDESFNIYLYSSDGKLFWKKQIDEKIIGSVIQLDLFKNKKLQFIFRTKNNLYIIDRNGKNVAPYPIKFEGKNPKKLSVFDYDNNRNYRFLIVNDNQIKMIDKNANLVKGFKFSKTNNKIINHVKHFRIMDKDYIIVQEGNGKLNILNRRGMERIKLNKKINLSENELFVYENSFITIDDRGNLVEIDTEGKVTINKSLNIGSILVSNRNTIVTMFENKININNVRKKLPLGKYTKPQIFEINSKIYICTTDIDNNLVYLFDSSGRIIEGFPIFGNTEIDMVYNNKSKSLKIIVGTNNGEISLIEIKEIKSN
tara:strand:- start:11518 stop:13959 length:2442 start_codon:yes stop_codon:yes gene_type:complete